MGGGVVEDDWLWTAVWTAVWLVSEARLGRSTEMAEKVYTLAWNEALPWPAGMRRWNIYIYILYYILYYVYILHKSTRHGSVGPQNLEGGRRRNPS